MVIHNGMALMPTERSKSTDVDGLIPTEPSSTELVNNFGNTYDSQGKYDEAIAQYKQALRIKENAFGVDYINTTETIGNIGLFHQSQPHAIARPLSTPQA